MGNKKNYKVTFKESKPSEGWHQCKTFWVCYPDHQVVYFYDKHKKKIVSFNIRGLSDSEEVINELKGSRPLSKEAQIKICTALTKHMDLLKLLQRFSTLRENFKAIIRLRCIVDSFKKEKINKKLTHSLIFNIIENSLMDSLFLKLMHFFDSNLNSVSLPSIFDEKPNDKPEGKFDKNLSNIDLKDALAMLNSKKYNLQNLPSCFNYNQYFEESIKQYEEIKKYDKETLKTIRNKMLAHSDINFQKALAESLENDSLKGKSDNTPKEGAKKAEIILNDFYCLFDKVKKLMISLDMCILYNDTEEEYDNCREESIKAVDDFYHRILSIKKPHITSLEMSF